MRSKFVLKLWNTYAFFCNYARLDGFDPAAPQVPVADRPDIDRWILSDLQLLIADGPRRRSRRSTCMAFCLEAEQFVDDKLSNWYVRRNRRRFWKSEQGARQAGRVSDAVHGADDADEAVRPGHAVPDRGDVPEPAAAGRRTRRASTCATTRRPTSR